MFAHITVGAIDIEASRKFYDAVFQALGHGPGTTMGRWLVYASQGDVFGVTLPIDGKPASHANGGTIGFVATSPEQVDAWHSAGLANGGSSCEDPPGVRDNDDGAKAYIGYLRDPVGNKLCAKYNLPG